MLKLNTKLLAVLLSVLLVSACSGSVDGYDIRKAELFCKDKGGIQSYGVFAQEFVTCFNGEQTIIAKLKKAN